MTDGTRKCRWHTKDREEECAVIISSSRIMCDEHSALFEETRKHVNK